MVAGSTQFFANKQGHAKVIKRLSLLPCRLFAASCICEDACSTNKHENCNNKIRTESEIPNGLSGSITLFMNTLIKLSWLSCSGAGGPPISLSASPRSNEIENDGTMTYCKILALSSC